MALMGLVHRSLKLLGLGEQQPHLNNPTWVEPWKARGAGPPGACRVRLGFYTTEPKRTGAPDRAPTVLANARFHSRSGRPDAPVHARRDTVDGFTALGLDRDAVHAAHAPGALREHDAS